MDELDLFLESILNPKRPPTFPLSLYYSEGVKFLQLKKYEQALEQFNKAYEMDPNNIKLLIKRCECFLEMRQYEKALSDAQAALRLSPNCLKVIDLKGEAEYQKGDFESSYKTYKKGLETRPMNKLLKTGLDLCEEAMNNSMKRETKIKMDAQDVSNLKDARHRKFIPGCRDNVPFMQNLKIDKQFLKQLLADPAVTDIHSLCQETISFISEKQRFWAMQMPCKRKTGTDEIQKRQGEKNSCRQHIALLMSRCSFFKQRGFTSSCISECNKLMKIIEECPGISQRDKLKLKVDIVHFISDAYKRDTNYVLYLKYLHEELKLSQEHDLLVGFIRASHSLAEYYQKSKNFSNFYRYFSMLNNKLKSDRFGMFWENRNELKNIFAFEDLLQESLSEVEKARVWAHGVGATFRKNLQETILKQASDNIKEAYREKTRHQNIDAHSISGIESDSGESEDFYPFESVSDSVESEESSSSI